MDSNVAMTRLKRLHKREWGALNWHSGEYSKVERLTLPSWFHREKQFRLGRPICLSCARRLQPDQRLLRLHQPPASA
jgi:hypothetical protein